MPVSVVHSARDEHKWSKAKEVAEAAGRAKDYAYIMGIYKRMKGGGLKKSAPFGVPQPSLFTMRTPGRMPTRTAMAALREAKESMKMPEGTRGARLLQETTPRLTIESITRNLGLDPSTELVWRRYLKGLLDAVPDEVNMRQALYTKMQEERMEAPMRRELMMRSVDYWKRQQTRKSLSVVTIDELRKAMDGAEGDCYKAMDAYLDTCGDEGAPLDSFDGFVARYGGALVRSVMDDAVKRGVMGLHKDETCKSGYRVCKSLHKARFVVRG